MNLHVFSDSLGYYSNETVSRIENLQLGNNAYMNLYADVKYRHPAVVYFNFTRKQFNEQLAAFPKIEKVYFHFFTIESTYILKKLKGSNTSLIVVWIIWSADLYYATKKVNNLYEAFSASFVTKKSLLRRIGGQVLQWWKSMNGKIMYSQQTYLNTLQKIDYIACILRHEFLFAKEILNIDIPQIEFAYLSYEQLIPKELLDKKTIGNKIMVNHSTDPSLNHYEVLELLHKNHITNPVFLPLAYGPAGDYRTKIIQVAKQWFGNQVEIQEDFIDKYEYAKKLTEVGYAIFNIKIQQGLGNIISLLWLGVKLFLREENAVYKDFKEWGLYIYSVQKELSKESFNRPLTPEQVDHNRQILAGKLSNEKVNEYYRNLMRVKSC